MKIYSYTMTDTFGGEANYAWTRRGEIELPEEASDLALVRKVKRALGMEGVRCRKEDWGETLALHPAGQCVVVFIEQVHTK